MTMRRAFGSAAMVLPLLLSGCSLLPMKRHLPVPKIPENVQTTTPEELVEQVNRRWDSFKNLTAFDNPVQYPPIGTAPNAVGRYQSGALSLIRTQLRPRSKCIASCPAMRGARSP